jgi:hypothetical protein
VCFLYLFIYLYLDGSRSNGCAYHSDFLKYDFFSIDMQTFTFVHCILSTHQHLGFFLQYALQFK